MCSWSSSRLTFSSSTTRLICSFLIPKPTGTSWEAPHTRPSFSMPRTDSSRAFMSVSSSAGTGLANRDVYVLLGGKSSLPHTARLHVQCHYRLGRRLGLGLLLLAVLSQALISDSRSLGIFLFVVAAEQVDVVIVLVRLH